MDGAANRVARHPARLASGTRVCSGARRARPRRFATVPEGDECAREAWTGLGATVKWFPIRPRARAIWLVCAVTCLRWIGLRSESGRATSGCSRRRRGPGSGGDRAACPRRGRSVAFRSTRWPSSFERRSSISGCSSMLWARRRARVFRSGHPSPRSGWPRVHRAVVLRGRRPLGEAIRRISLARPGSRSVKRERPDRARRWCSSAPRGEEFGKLQANDDDLEDGDPGTVDAGRPSSRFGRGGRGSRHAAIAVEVGRADRRIRGGRRAQPPGWQGAVAAPARRAGGRLRYRIGELERDEPESPRIARFVRDLRNLSHLREFALPIIDALAEWPERATWGEWLDWFSALAVSALGRPERVLADARRVAANGRRGAGRDRGGARRAARSPCGARLGAARAPVRAVVRRHPAPGPWSQLPRRLCPGSRRARRAAAAARGSAPAR